LQRITPSFPIRWTLTQLDPSTGRPRGDELPAQVPGDVFSDLLRAGVGPDQVVHAGEVRFTLPPDQPPRLELAAREAGQEVSRNLYDLTFHDPEPASLLLRRLSRRWWQFLSE